MFTWRRGIKSLAEGLRAVLSVEEATVIHAEGMEDHIVYNATKVGLVTVSCSKSKGDELESRVGEDWSCIWQKEGRDTGESLEEV